VHIKVVVLEWVGGEKKRPETRHAEVRRGEVL